MKISEMKESDVAVITDCDDSRLLENGFIPGTEIQMHKKVFGLISIAVRGTIIALRKEEYDKIIIE